MNDMIYLGQASPDAASGSAVTGTSDLFQRIYQDMDIINRPEDLLNALAQLPLVLAGVFVVVGLMCILNGYRWHKWVVVVLAFMMGIGLGHVLADHVGNARIVAASIGVLCALIATPMLKLTVALFGGLTGSFIGASAWSALSTTAPEAHWAGAAMGFIALTFASFLLFRMVIVMFTSIGGGTMLVFGAITLLMRVDVWEESVRASLSANQALIPLLVAVTAVAGFVMQETKLKAAGAPAEKTA